MTKATFLFKYQEFILFVGLTLWLSIFHITETKSPEWSSYFYCALILSINQLPALVFAFNKTHFRETLTQQRYIIYWCVCFLFVQPVFTAFCISLASESFDPSFFITAALSALALELLLTINFYYQKKVKNAKWLKKIGLENSVLISLILMSLVIAAMGASSINNPLYHNKERLLIGFEFSITKIFNNFGTFLLFFVQFLFMYLCGYLFFIINSRLLVSQVLKQKGLLLYILSALATIVILYPIIAQLLISLPINKTLGRDIFSNNAFDLENAFGVMGVMLFSLPIVLAMQWGMQNSHILSLEREKSQTELDLLKQQLNPHFFFNTLNNLYGLSLQQSDKTSDSILRLAELMRYTIYKGQQEHVSLLQELNYIEDYIQLQQIRLKKRLHFNFEKHLANENLQIAPLLLIVLVENAFKHGIEPAEDETFLNLYLKSDQTKLYFSCENSVEEEYEAKVSGIGLSNLKKRLALLYPNKHSLTIKHNKKSYLVELENNDMSLRCLIIDDEPLAHDVILTHLEDIPFLQCVGQCYRAIDALDFLSTNEVDLIFLDIRMPKLSGLDFIKTLTHKPIIIITSAFEEYALESFDLDICDYLLKPFRFDRLLKASNRALALYQLKHQSKLANSDTNLLIEDDYITIKADKRHILVKLNEILYFESLGNYVKVWKDNEFLLTPRTLTSFEEQLPETQFIRIHKSFILHKKFVNYFEGNMIILKNGTRLPIGKNYKAVIKLLTAAI